MPLACLVLSSAVQAQDKATVLVRTDLDCQWSIDGESKGTLRVDDRVRVTLALGQHLVEATPTTGGAHWEQVLDIKDSKPQVFSIPLLALVRTMQAQRQPEAARVGLAANPSWEREEQETTARGYWVDPETKLMWASKDNGYRALEWKQAAAYCKKLNIAGYTGWVLPHLNELRSIFDPAAWSNSYKPWGGPKGGIKLTNNTEDVWSDMRDPGRPSAWASFDFGLGNEWAGGGTSYALCVRRP